MRFAIWLVLLFSVAVLAAGTLGVNDGLASFYWSGWRFDVSLNLFLLAFIGGCFLIVSVIQALDALTGLPRRAMEWRTSRRDRGAQLALREALAHYFSGRYSRAQKAAQHALAIQESAVESEPDLQFAVLGHLLAAGSAHRLQDPASRDQALQQALRLANESNAARAAGEGARLLAAEWAIDDRDGARALALLAELPVGVARRTHALRLRLQASRLARLPVDALKTARLLAKHQGFSSNAAQGLLRSLAFETLDGTRDADQLRRTWLQFDPLDRRDPFVASHAAVRAAGFGAFDDARGWLRPFWEQLATFDADARRVLSLALVQASPGIGADWLPRLEAAASAHPRESAVALAVGCALFERELFGKARPLLTHASADADLPGAARRQALRNLAALARREGDADAVLRHLESASAIP